jgi:putative hydrolase of the HAD superfamily
MTPGIALRRLLSSLGMAEYFRIMVFSNEVGFRKPSRRIFRLAAQALGVEPKDIVHIGDNLKSDVWGAKNAGFRAIYLSGNVGRDRLAESDPKSLVTLSRDLGRLTMKRIEPDETIASLSMVKQAIEKIEANLLRKSAGKP